MKILTLEYIKQKTKEWAEEYECLATEYINAHTKYNNRCKNRHIYETSWNNFQTGRRCPECWIQHMKSCWGEKFSKNNHPRWKGGVTKKDIPLYNTYAYQINWIEEVRRDPKNKDYLQTKCKNSDCREWFTPKRNAVKRRINALNGTKSGEHNFYCSNKCKQRCSTFNRTLYPKGFVPEDYERKDQKEWSDLVKERDNYKCIKCGSTEDLIAHHIEGLNINPLESADIDIGITLCTECNKLAHSGIGCRYADLQKRNLCK